MPTANANHDTTEATIARHDRHMTLNYPRYPVAIVRGEGCVLYDADGTEYLDLFAGYGAGLLGHCHEGLVQAVRDQAETLWHVGNLLHTEPQTRLAEAIARNGFGGRSFFCHSGADANEAAFKLARLYGREHPGPRGPRYGVISATQSFHGRSFGTMGATGQDKVREGFEPLLPGYTNVPYNQLDAVEQAIDAHTIAVIVEPIQAEGGVNVPDKEYQPGLRALCDRHNLVLIVDEVWTGCGRTGRYFAHQHWGITPDVMTLGKGVGGGLTLGVMCANDRVAGCFDHKQQGAVRHATTLGGNCIATAAGAAVFDILDHDGLVERAATLGQTVIERFEQLAKQTPAIQSVRGLGLLIGIELDPAAINGTGVADVVKACLAKGVMVGGAQNNVLRLAPPLTISDNEIDRGLNVIEDVLRGA